MFSP
ncbi:hypothetical protein YPPY14_4090, partial [Yersinia pestis PY-14]|jgi:hypothetical protein